MRITLFIMVVFFVGFVVFRSLRLRDLYAIFLEAAVSTSVVMIVIGFAGLFSWTGSTLGVRPDKGTGCASASSAFS